MKVQICIQSKNGKKECSAQTYTVKKAKEVFDKELKNDTDIIYVYLKSWGTWDWKLHSVLKDERVRHSICCICGLTKEETLYEVGYCCSDVFKFVKNNIEKSAKCLKFLKGGKK